MFTFTSVHGSSTESHVLQSLLTFDDDVRVLINVGWDSNFSPELLDGIAKLTPAIDLILLSHATIDHLGAYVYCCKAFPGFAAIPVYATLPVINLGRAIIIDSYKMLDYELVGQRHPLIPEESASDSDNFSAPQHDPSTVSMIAKILGTIPPADVDTIFDHINSIKYSQSTTLSGKLEGLTITGYNAGHTVGGTIWRLQKGQENVVYAADWNHTRDRHLNPCAFLKGDGTVLDAFVRPSALITTARSGIAQKRREETLLDQILTVLKRHGTVLLPVTAGARFIELAYILDSYWTKQNMGGIPLLFLATTSLRVAAYAQSMLEWMSSHTVTDWQSQTSSPFEFNHLKLLTTMEQLSSISGPKVILCTDECLQNGFSKIFFTDVLSADEKSAVIFTTVPNPRSFGAVLCNARNTKLYNSDSSPALVPLDEKYKVEIERLSPLKGKELEIFQEALKDIKVRQEAQTAMNLRNRNILAKEDESDSSDDEQDDLMMMPAVSVATGKVDIGSLVLLQDNAVYDFDVRTAKGRNKMFPFTAERRRVDDYGEEIEAEKFMRIEEKEDNNRMNDGQKQGGDEQTFHQLQQQEQQQQLGRKRHFGERQQDEEASEEAKPTKLITETREINVRCSISFVDMQGLADTRSMKMIVPQLHPRQLLLIGSPQDETSQQLVENFRMLGIDKVYSCQDLVSVNASVDTNAYTVQLSEQLYRSLKWQAVTQKHTVAHLIAKVTIQQQLDEEEEEETHTKEISNVNGTSQDADGDISMEKEMDEEKKDKVKDTLKNNNNNESSTVLENGSQKKKKSSIVVLEQLSSGQDLSQTPGTLPLLVGDVGLADLKRTLIDLGHRAELRGDGILLCDGIITVTKDGNGNISIQGGLSREFYDLRRVVYSFLGVV